MKIVISEDPFETQDWPGIVLALDCGDIAARIVCERTMRLLKMHKHNVSGKNNYCVGPKNNSLYNNY